VRGILKVHRSNFRITGFTEEASLAALAEVAGRHRVPLLHDLGSGLMVPPARVGLTGEPTPQESLAAGADIVTFSGDKLLGGPQAGILLGRRELIDAARANPLCRALRVDKVTLAGLEATLRLYRDPRLAISEIPTLRMLAAKPAELEERALRLAALLAAQGVSCSAVRAEGAVGGGTFPGVALESWAVELETASAADIARALREGEPPVIGHVRDDRLLLDVRTVLPGQDGVLVRRIREATVPMNGA
jgi:L-seryl-tRNA(Ser) seleniumtransferase